MENDEQKIVYHEITIEEFVDIVVPRYDYFMVKEPGKKTSYFELHDESKDFSIISSGYILVINGILHREDGPALIYEKGAIRPYIVPFKSPSLPGYRHPLESYYWHGSRCESREDLEILKIKERVI